MISFGIGVNVPAHEISWSSEESRSSSEWRTGPEHRQPGEERASQLGMSLGGKLYNAPAAQKGFSLSPGIERRLTQHNSSRL